MILKAYSLLDTKVGSFSAPMFFAHEAHCIRAIISLGTDMSTMIGRYPSDYHLYLVGEFDDGVGLLNVVGPVGMGPVLNFLPKPQAAAPSFAEEV